MLREPEEGRALFREPEEGLALLREREEDRALWTGGRALLVAVGAEDRLPARAGCTLRDRGAARCRAGACRTTRR